MNLTQQIFDHLLELTESGKLYWTHSEDGARYETHRDTVHITVSFDYNIRVDGEWLGRYDKLVIAIGKQLEQRKCSKLQDILNALKK